MKINRNTALSAVIAASMLGTACGFDPETNMNGGVYGPPPEEEPAVTTLASIETAAAAEELDTIDTAPSDPVDLSAGLTEAMYARALLSEGNRSRLAKAMQKAESGEITVGVIGGSITQGTAASSPDSSYAGLFRTWWEEKFPNCKVNYVNAGIGGTSSYLGVHRVDEQLLSANPDVVIVEFSVNDTDKLLNKNSYDSLVRKILNSEGSPAVILLFTTQENGTSLQDVHREIGAAYDLPMLSYREAVYPEVAAGTLNWADISPDNIHPNDVGHGLIGQIVSRYLDSVYSDMDSIDTSDLSIPEKSYTADYYKDGKMLGASDLNIIEQRGFETAGNKTYPELFPSNLVTEGEGYVKFEVECRCLGIFYLEHTNGKAGKYEIWADGERKAAIDADFSGGWGTYGDTKQVVFDKELKKRTIEIKLAEGSEKTEFTVLGVMVS